MDKVWCSVAEREGVVDAAGSRQVADGDGDARYADPSEW